MSEAGKITEDDVELPDDVERRMYDTMDNLTVKGLISLTKLAYVRGRQDQLEEDHHQTQDILKRI